MFSQIISTKLIQQSHMLQATSEINHITGNHDFKRLIL